MVSLGPAIVYMCVVTISFSLSHRSRLNMLLCCYASTLLHTLNIVPSKSHAICGVTHLLFSSVGCYEHFSVLFPHMFHSCLAYKWTKKHLQKYLHIPSVRDPSHRNQPFWLKPKAGAANSAVPVIVIDNAPISCTLLRYHPHAPG